MYAIKSPETKKRYPDRFKTVLDYIQIPGIDIEERLVNFYNQASKNLPWLQSSTHRLFHISKRARKTRTSKCR